jgi:alkylation response protein AidB-like acyl-CoA dehydrogenase
MSLRSTIDFLLYDWLDAESLNKRERFTDHSRETFDAVLDMCERIAREKYAPFNRLVDTQEPHFDGEKVILPQATHDAHKAYVDSGMLSAAQDYALNGMQLPYTVEAAANAFFACASVSIGSNMLTAGNAGLLLVHGTDKQKEVFANNEFSGRWAGTMCLSEPQAGSSLSDITTRATPDIGSTFEDDWQNDALGPRYRLKGNKMWISSGDHELTENIIHLVLAKIPDEDGKLIAGTRGISLFIVPKKIVNTKAELTGERNDVALAGLNHKLGWRGTTNTLLNFGEGKFTPGSKAGAIGYLVGKPGEGLRCMFHMMNKARIGVGTAATMLGFAGYYASLDYAKNRPQGRVLGASEKGTLGKDAAQPQVRIIEHADVKRMLLAQKSYCEGALALELYCARMVDEEMTGDASSAEEARLILEVLMPIAKSWPSEWCLEANSLAIQIHGGYGYTRDFPVEQYWRDNRLNMIHEGTHGIQAADLLGRKVIMDGGKAWQLLVKRISATSSRALKITELEKDAEALSTAVQAINEATQAVWATKNPNEALANAVPYMQAFGHVIIAWMWLDIAINKIAAKAINTPAKTYFYNYELPKIAAWLHVVTTRDLTCVNMIEEDF